MERTNPWIVENTTEGAPSSGESNLNFWIVTPVVPPVVTGDREEVPVN